MPAAQTLQTPPRKRHHLTLTLLIRRCLLFSRDITLRNRLDRLNNIIRSRNALDEPFVAGLEQL